MAWFQNAVEYLH